MDQWEQDIIAWFDEQVIRCLQQSMHALMEADRAPTPETRGQWEQVSRDWLDSARHALKGQLDIQANVNPNRRGDHV